MTKTKGEVLSNWELKFSGSTRQFLTLTNYNKRYYLTHPWVILEEIWQDVVWAYQRVVRGWDDRVLWSICDYLLIYVPIWIQEYRKDIYGVSGYYLTRDDFDENFHLTDEGRKRSQKRMDKSLDKIVEGFVAGQVISASFDPIDKESGLYKKYATGMNELRDVLFSLWD